MRKKYKDLHILIITGFSGAGKTLAINCLEDIGYYCVDNLPPALIMTFVELSMKSEGKIKKVALVIDVRGGEFFHDLSQALKQLGANGIPYEILFLEASDEVLVRRFKESRRRHPLADRWRLLEAIQMERNMLEDLRGEANIVIDTTDLSPREFRVKLRSLYSERETDSFFVNIVSFGYKLGIPLDSDIVMDVRFLPNPFYNPGMQSMTGKDREVIAYVLESSAAQAFSRRFLSLLKFLIPYYIKEGKTNLAVSIGCTGGQHRSVVLADYIGKRIKKMGYKVIIRHRDIEKSGMEE